MTSAGKIKRHRDPLSPKPILDRDTLSKELHVRTNGGLKNPERQIDLFYQLLHRSGYNTSLDVFVASLLRDGGAGSTNTVNGSDVDSKLPTKNAVSNRPGRLPKLSNAFLQYLSDTCIDTIVGFVMLTSKVKMHETSADGTTTKLQWNFRMGTLWKVF